MLAIGLLSMHGLAVASATSSAGTGVTPGHEGVAAVPIAMATGRAADHTMNDTGGGHDPMHAIGQACLWLLVGSALLLFAHRFGRSLTARLADVRHGRRLERIPWSTFHHPPDPRLATVALRC